MPVPRAYFGQIYGFEGELSQTLATVDGAFIRSCDSTTSRFRTNL